MTKRNGAARKSRLKPLALDISLGDLKNQIGVLRDKAENFLAWGDNPFASQDIKLGAFSQGLKELRDDLKALCEAL
jgi:hypothetical protein